MWLVAVFICLGWMLSLCLHEFGHAVVAYWGGDTSVKDKGYLTLNPLKYTEPSLSLVMPLFFLLIGGIALPGGAVYINQNRLRDRKWKSAVSAAGPIANIILVCLLALPFQLGWHSLVIESQNSILLPLITALAYIISLDIYVVLINLLPIPALDGYGILEPWLPQPIQQQFNKIAKFGIWVLIGLLWFARPFNQFLWGFTNTISGFLQVPEYLTVFGGEIFRQNSQYLIIGIVVCLWIFRDKNKALQQQGNKLVSSQQYEEAIACYDKAIKNQQKNADAWYLRGYALYCLNKYEDAIASYDQAIKIQPENHNTWYLRGYSLYLLKKYPEAITSYEKALELQADDPEIWYHQGIALADLGQYEEAIASYNQAIKLQAKDGQAWIDKGVALEKLHQNEEALAAYNQGMQLQPNSQDWIKQVKLLEKLQRYEQALTVYDQRIKLETESADIWYRRGLILEKLQKTEEALAAYNEAIAIQSDFYQAWYKQGEILTKLQRYEKAIAAYNKVIEIRPDDSNTYWLRGQTLAAQKYYQAAVASYDQAITIYSDFYAFWLDRGNALYYLQQYEDAIASYDKVIQLKPENNNGWNYKGVALLKLQRYKEALIVYDKAIEINSNCADYWYNKACCYALQSNITLATQNLQQSIKLESKRFRKLAKTDSHFDGICEHQLFKILVDGFL